MNVTVTQLALSSIVAVTAVSNAAWAEDTCHGYSIGNAKSRVLVHLLGVVPMHLASGACGESSPGRPGEMTSECTYYDDDGDQWTSRSAWADGAAHGTWCNVSGTGKYEKRMGGCGWWKLVKTGALNAWEFGGQCQVDQAK